MRVLFLGPCRKHNRRTGEVHPAFDPKTPSGRYISLVQAALSNVASDFKFANVIDAPHFSSETGAEKNPHPSDLITHWAQFERRVRRMRVDCIIAFGSNVRTAFALADQKEYADGKTYSRGRQKVIFAPHPSFVMIYRRRAMHKYIESLRTRVQRLAYVS